MSGGVAYVYDPHGRFGALCNLAMVELERLGPTANVVEIAGRPRQRALDVQDNGMGDMLHHDSERLRILIERHLLHTGSSRARALLEDWDASLTYFVKVMPKDYRRALLDLEAERLASKTVAAE
jgi:glutamate synthase (NADPH/NADH) large chain